MPSPYQGTFACPKPGTQGDIRLHVTNALMQSSDAVVGYSSVAVDVSLVVVVSSCPIIITVSPEKHRAPYRHHWVEICGHGLSFENSRILGIERHYVLRD